MPPTTIPELFAAAAAERARADCFAYKDAGGRWASVSTTEALERVQALRLALDDLGLRPGDRVALISENRVEWALTDLAVLCHGGLDVPIYPTLMSDTVAYILQDCQAEIVFVSTADQAAKIDAVRDRLPFLRHLVSFDPTARKDWLEFAELLERGRRRREALPGGAAPPFAPVGGDDLASIIYTSGTTGQPKGVMLTHANFVSNVLAAASLVPIGTADRCLSFLPLSHVLERMAGFYLMLHGGVGIAYAESIDTVPQDLLEVKPTIVVSVPRLYEKIYARVMGMALAGSPLKKNIFFWAKKVGERYGRLKRDRGTIPVGLKLQYRLADRLVFAKLRLRTGGRLRFFVSGGAPLAAEINEFFYAAGMYIMEGYGLTETSPVLAVNTFEHFRIGSVGPPVPGTEIRIADDGEIMARGPQIMRGYHNQPEATREVLAPDGWLATGDIGHLDQDGYLYITDRKKDLIVTAGGKNVAPQPIENEFKQNRYVSQIVVIGDRRPYLACLIVPNFDNLRIYASQHGIAAESAEELIAHPEIRAMYERQLARVNSRLAGFEQLKRFALLRHELTLENGELTPTLKVKRQVIQQRYRDLIEALYAENRAA